MEDASNRHNIAATTGVGDAVGVPDGRRWFVAVVGHNTEKACHERLQKLGYESYVATQTETRQWRNGRKHTVERVVISTLVFLHATEEERLQTVALPFVKRFLTDKAAPANRFGIHPLAEVPPQQLQRLQFMLYNADRPVEFVSAPLQTGDPVRIVRGSLKGLQGHVVTYRDGTSRLVVRLGALGCATLSIGEEDVEKEVKGVLKMLSLCV